MPYLLQKITFHLLSSSSSLSNFPNSTLDPKFNYYRNKVYCSLLRASNSKERGNNLRPFPCIPLAPLFNPSCFQSTLVQPTLPSFRPSQLGLFQLSLSHIHLYLFPILLPPALLFPSFFLIITKLSSFPVVPPKPYSAMFFHAFTSSLETCFLIFILYFLSSIN
jgi:hypothetical protein